MSLSHKLDWTCKLIFGIYKMIKLSFSVFSFISFLKENVGRKLVISILWLINLGVIQWHKMV